MNRNTMRERMGDQTMKDLTVCVGSSCHLQGSYPVLKTFERLIKEEHLGDKVTLKASFCQGRCMQGLSITLDGEPVEGVTIVNAEDVFRSRIMPQL